MAAYLLLYLELILFIANIQSKNVISQKEDTIDLSKKGYLKDDSPVPTLEYKHSKPTVTLFYECMCPGCRKFDTTYFPELLSKLGDHIKVKTYAYGKAATTTYYNGTVTFWCQHGEPECYGNKLHGCAQKFIHNNDNIHLKVLFNSCLMEFERSENGSNDDAVDECGSKLNINLGVISLIKKCAKNEIGTTLLKYVGEQSIKANYTSLPHVEINHKHWTGKHEDLIKDVCATFIEPPEPCKDLV